MATAASSAQPAVDEGAPTPPRRRHWPVHVLTVLAAVILLLTATNTWVKRQVLDTDRWVSTSDELLADPEIRAALATYLVDELYNSVDIGAQLEERLPDSLDGLASSVAAGLRGPAAEAVDRLLATDAAREVWTRANTRAHETLMNILNDETRPGVSTAGGTVTLDLREILVQLADRLGLPGTVVDRIPEGAGTIVVFESDQLDAAQQAVSVIEWASILLFFVIVVLYGAAVALAVGWRRRAIRNVGISVAVVGLLMLVLQRVARNYVVEELVARPENRRIASEAWLIASELLRNLAWSGVALGAAIALAAALVGPSRPAVALRRAVTPAVAGNPMAVWGVTAGFVLLMLVWSPLDLFTAWFGVAALVVVIVVGAELFRRTCVRESSAPPAEGLTTTA